MKPIIIYLRVVSKSDANAPDPSYYYGYITRFIETYKKFKPSIDHELIVCNCGVDSKPDNNLDEISQNQMCYSGGGWDIGAHQFCAQRIDGELMLFLSTPVYFHRHGWLERLVEARVKHGDAFYGTMTSNYLRPHIRTSFYACSSNLYRLYPHVINTRALTYMFETGTASFLDFVLQKSLPAVMVTFDGEYQYGDWRKPDNVFRKGDQSNCLAWDRHSDGYVGLSKEQQNALCAQTDGQ